MPSGEEASAQIETQEIPFKHKRTHFLLSAWSNTSTGDPEIAQRVSIPGDIQNLTGHSHEQQADSALRKRVELDFLHEPFCGSLKNNNPQVLLS